MSKLSEELFDQVVLPDDPEVILAWARTLPPEEIVGVCGDPLACIVSMYLKTKYPHLHFCIAPSSGLGGGQCTMAIPFSYHDERRLPLPPALNAFALAFDDLRASWQRRDRVMLTVTEFFRRWDAREEKT